MEQAVTVDMFGDDVFVFYGHLELERDARILPSLQILPEKQLRPKAIGER